MSDFYHLHAHSDYSYLDALDSVELMVQRVVEMGQPALALTDHGVMSGTTRLYKECKKNNVVPFPGSELYVVENVADKDRSAVRHMTMVALDKKGYQGMVRLSSLSHQRDHYHFKPRVDDVDLASFAEAYGSHVVVMTGCFFGVLSQSKNPVATLKKYSAWFPNLFVELQRHGISDKDHDDEELSSRLYDVAQECGVPVVITQDSHYVYLGDKRHHDFFKSFAYVGGQDSVFPGDGYHLSTENWMHSHWDGREDIWQDSQESLATILEMNRMEIPPLDQYQFKVPSSGFVDPMKELKTRIKRFSPMPSDERSRVNAELAVIEAQGFADYFVLVSDLAEWMQANNILYNVRGSASGSFVLYALGITQIDPLKWDLLFERFLTRDRSKPPDIDLDIEDTRRDEVIDYLKRHHDVLQIGTFSRLGLNENGKGSLLVQYVASQRNKLGKAFTAVMGDVKTVDDLRPEVARQLIDFGERFSPRKSAGAHAAGFVVAGKDQSIGAYLPTMLIPSSGNQVTQMVMEDVEDLGYMKLDLLGQRTLTTVKALTDYLGIRLSDIPLDDVGTMAMLRRGQTVGVFQLEGWSARKGCKELKVKTTEDIVNVMALYRPATLASGYKDLYITNRANPKKVSYPHPIFKQHLSSTYGVAIFQEQIMRILRDFGVPVDQLNAFLKALKLSNKSAGDAREIFDDYRAQFVGLAEEQGADGDEAWDLISGFSGYGFNRAHGVAYGLLAYRMAYLKYHYTNVFMGLLLQTSVGTYKEDDYVEEAHNLGVRILAPCANRSGVSWEIDDSGGIRRGLSSIKGIGAKAAHEIVSHQPFVDLDDLMTRCDSRRVSGGNHYIKTGEFNGVLKTLEDAGALRELL